MDLQNPEETSNTSSRMDYEEPPNDTINDTVVENDDNVPGVIDDRDMAFRLAVVGSRKIKNADIIEPLISQAIKKIEVLTGGFVHTIVSGGASGVDTIAEEYARFNNILFKAHLPDKDKLAEGQLSAFNERSIDIVDDAHFVLAIWDGRSKGTAYTVKYARKQEKLSTIPPDEDDDGMPKEDLNVIIST